MLALISRDRVRRVDHADHESGLHRLVSRRHDGTSDAGTVPDEVPTDQSERSACSFRYLRVISRCCRAEDR